MVDMLNCIREVAPGKPFRRSKIDDGFLIEGEIFTLLLSSADFA